MVLIDAHFFYCQFREASVTLCWSITCFDPSASDSDPQLSWMNVTESKKPVMLPFF
jgi:hypothetical protein